MGIQWFVGERGHPTTGFNSSHSTRTIRGGDGENHHRTSHHGLLVQREGRKIAAATARKYRTFVKQLRAFADSKGYVMMDQFSQTDMDEFYLGWKDGVRARGKKLERLKGFFKFCLKRKMITENPAEDLEAPVGAGSAANKTPFTDQEIQRMLTACGKVGPVAWKNGTQAGEWSGVEVETFILLEIYTGLRTLTPPRSIWNGCMATSVFSECTKRGSPSSRGYRMKWWTGWKRWPEYMAPSHS